MDTLIPGIPPLSLSAVYRDEGYCLLGRWNLKSSVLNPCLLSLQDLASNSFHHLWPANSLSHPHFSRSACLWHSWSWCSWLWCSWLQFISGFPESCVSVFSTEHFPLICQPEARSPPEMRVVPTVSPCPKKEGGVSFSWNPRSQTSGSSLTACGFLMHLLCVPRSMPAQHLGE